MELRDKNGLTEQEFLEQYKPGNYKRPSATADVLLFRAPNMGSHLSIPYLSKNNLEILLIQRGGHPFLNAWAIPGGFLNPSETVTEAAYREMKEETGLDNLSLTQLYTFSKPGRDPRTWVISTAHIAVIEDPSLCPVAGDDAKNAQWFTVNLKIRKKEGNIVQYALQLNNASSVIHTIIECPEGPFNESSCKVLKNDGLAFDHPQMLLCGLLHLLNR